MASIRYGFRSTERVGIVAAHEPTKHFIEGGINYATVLPGGRVEVVNQELTEGENVDVVISRTPTPTGRSIMEILNSGPERRLFQTADEVKGYLKEEKASWHR